MRKFSMTVTVATLVALVIAVSAMPVAAATAPYRVKNINKAGSSPVGNSLYFVARAGKGTELWRYVP